MWNTEIYENAAGTWNPGAAVVSPAWEAHPRRLRTTLGKFATGVVALTYASGDAYYGVAVSSFTSCPPWPAADPGVAQAHLAGAHVPAGVSRRGQRPRYRQLSTALEFAGGPQGADPVGWVTDERVPRINGSLAYFRCTPWVGYDGGDHVLVLGRVLSHGEQDDLAPLLFYGGKWSALAPEPDGAERAS